MCTISHGRGGLSIDNEYEGRKEEHWSHRLDLIRDDRGNGDTRVEREKCRRARINIMQRPNLTAREISPYGR